MRAAPILVLAAIACNQVLGVGDVRVATTDAGEPIVCPRVVLDPPTCAPVLRSSFVSNSNVPKAETRGTTLYVAQLNTGFAVFDVSNPSSPIARGATGAVATDMTAALGGNMVVFAEGGFMGHNDVNVVNVSNPMSPMVIARINKRSDGSDLRGITVTSAGPGHPLWVRQSFTGYLTAFDLSNPAAPTQVATIDEISNGATANADRLYVNQGSQVAIFDNDATGSPKAIASYPLQGTVLDAAVDAGRMYVASPTNAELHVVDVSGPRPRCLSVVEIKGAVHVATSGNRIAVALHKLYDTTDHLAILDVSTPTKPRLLGLWSGGTMIGISLSTWMFGPNGDTVADTYYTDQSSGSGFAGVRLFDIASCR